MEVVHTSFEPAGEGPFATIVALHGWAAGATDLLGLAPHLGGGRYLVLCPQARLRVPMGPIVGWGWYPLVPGAQPDAAELASGVDDVRRFLDAAVRRYPIDPARTVLLGYSQGGVVAQALALAEPERFAAVVGLSTWLPETLVARLPSVDRSRLPVLVQHGSRDQVIHVDRARASVERLRALVEALSYREFDMDHEINGLSLAHLSDWLDERVP